MRDSTQRFFTIGATGGFQQSFFDAHQRFGYGGLVGAELMYKSKKNWTIQAQYNYLFSNQVKEDTILKPLLTRQGDLINREGEFADVFLSQRGFLASLEIGKIISVGKANPSSGLHLTAGAGFMQHRIFINESSEKVPQLVGDYKKGYDRLTNGFMLTQSIGYSFFSNYKLVNFYAGVKFYQGFTQNRRAINFDTGIADHRQRFDMIGSLVLRWYFPIYKRQAQDFYFY